MPTSRPSAAAPAAPTTKTVRPSELRFKQPPKHPAAAKRKRGMKSVPGDKQAIKIHP